MTRKQADAAFDSLRRHASAITAPSGPADALKLLDRAVLSKLQRDAMIHYISVGPDNLALAYSVVKAGAASFATAGFVARAAGGRGSPANPAEASAERDLFADRLIALSSSLDGADPAQLATRLLDAFTGHIAIGCQRLLGQEAGDASGEMLEATGDLFEATGDLLEATGDLFEATGDLFEAAGIAYLIGQLLESPPRRVAPAPLS
jgi:hypothetical protein